MNLDEQRATDTAPAAQPGQEPTDEDLLEQLQRGDAQALVLLAARYGDSICRRARRAGLSAEEAESVAQETWLRILERVHTYNKAKAGPSGAAGWITTIARNEITNVGRVYGRALDLQKQLATAPHHTGDDVYKRAQHDALRATLALLSPNDRRELLERGAGRGPGRKVYHEVIERLRPLFFTCFQATQPPGAFISRSEAGPDACRV